MFVDEKGLENLLRDGGHEIATDSWAEIGEIGQSGDSKGNNSRRLPAPPTVPSNRLCNSPPSICSNPVPHSFIQTKT